MNQPSLAHKTFTTFRSRRWVVAWVEAALMIGVPFLRVQNESALRFDVPSLKLYFFGSVIWISEAYFFLLVFLLFLVGIMLFTVLYGRIWCGWMCPQTVLSVFSRRLVALSERLSDQRFLRAVISQFLLLLFSVIVSASLIWYFVSPYEMASDIFARQLGPWTTGIWAFFAFFIYLNLAFVRQKFCGSVCPYARFQSAFFDDKTLTIAFDRALANDCGGCEACVRVCPAGIDIREGLQVECINCAECIDACSKMMRAKNKGSLIRYARESNSSKGPRARVAGLAAAFGIIAVLFAYQAYIRMPLAFWVFRDEPQPIAQIAQKGSMINVYSLIIENRNLKPAICQLSITGIKDVELHMGRNPFIIPPNSVLKTKVYVVALRKNLHYHTSRLHFTIEDVSSHEIRREQEATFIYPERSESGWEI
ncbi:MAG TPA: 4Fe-4S dicluster domain-containing protein [Nitrospirota bacterium]|nr:4Fe-4S dicluster domain-containing protein [Nitrospirota bacterium]